MSIENFISQIETEIDGLQPGVLKPETTFRSMEEWSSMHSLIVIALIDVEYGVTISGEDLLNSKTINDLYNLILTRK
jgi:acyl carrier protein